MLEKYHRPANRTELYPIKVNQGAWENLKWHKKQHDLRLANLQQCLLKIACISLQNTNALLEIQPQHGKPEGKMALNAQISGSIDAIALLGHVHGNITSLRKK